MFAELVHWNISADIGRRLALWRIGIVGGRWCGTLVGIMNMMGGVVAAMAPAIVAVILERSHENWTITFYLSAAIYFMGTFFWLALDPTQPMDAGAET